jgi:hypothetical protein
MKHLTDQQLEMSLWRAIRGERFHIRDELALITEMARRDLPLRRASPSLFAFLVEKYGFSEGSAQRRIDALRLAEAVESVPELFEQGQLSFEQISAIQRGIRIKERTFTMLPAEKEELVKLVAVGKTSEAAQIVADCLGIALPRRTFIQEDSSGGVRIAVTLCPEDWSALKKSRERLSHAIPYGEMAEVMGAVARFFLSKTNPSSDEFTATPVVAPQHLYGALPDSVRRFIHRRDKVCQYTDRETGQRCGGKFRLEVDHIIPRSEGGSNDPGNLRLLCRPHNQLVSPADRFGKKKPKEHPSP